MKPRIKSMIWNIRNQNPVEQQEKKKNPKNEESVRSLWDNFKLTNISVIGVPEGEENKEIGNLLENIMKANFPDLVKEIAIQGQETQAIPNKMDANSSHQDTS